MVKLFIHFLTSRRISSNAEVVSTSARLSSVSEVSLARSISLCAVVISGLPESVGWPGD